MRKFRAYIDKYWETAATKKNYQQSEAKLLNKYGGLQLNYDNDGIIYIIYPRNIELKKGRNGVWMTI